MSKKMETARCRARHYDLWMIEPVYFNNAVANVRNGTIKAMEPAAFDSEDERSSYKPYDLADGIATISIDGPMMKGSSKYGGTSTVDMRDAIRKAVKDEAVKAIILHVDSPGGTVAGTSELAADVRAANAAKPVFTHVEDLCASAAYWVASQTRNIQATATSEIGSIGVVMQLADTSGAYEKEGIQVHTLSTGAFKGAGFDGAPVTAEHLAYFQSRLDDLYGHFLNAVKSGRGMSIENVRSAADGKVFGAEKAKEMGLIDGVGSIDDTRVMVKRIVAAADLLAAKALVDGENKGSPPVAVDHKAEKIDESEIVIVSKSLTVLDSAKNALRQRFGLASGVEVCLASCSMVVQTNYDLHSKFDSMPKQTKDGQPEDPHWFKARITTDALDRDGEVMIPQGMIGTEFEKNGTIFWNHNYDLPIAAALGKLVRGDREWVSEGRFAERPSDYVGEFYPDYVRALVSQRIVRGVSVGFIPIESRKPTEKDFEIYGRGVKRVHSKWKMLEWSFAPIQSNVEAMVLDAIKKGYLSPAGALDLFDGLFSDDAADILMASAFIPSPLISVGRNLRHKTVQTPSGGSKTENGPEKGQSGAGNDPPVMVEEPEHVILFLGAPKAIKPERVDVVQVAAAKIAKARGRVFER